jgi:hypothetical protein
VEESSIDSAGNIPSKGSKLREMLNEAKSQNRVLTKEELALLGERAREQLEDHQGSIDAIRKSYLNVLQLRSSLASAISKGAPVAVEMIEKSEAFIECVKEQLREIFPAAEVLRVEGAGKYRALIDFTNLVDTVRDRETALKEAVERENIRGPLTHREREEAKAQKIPLVFGERGAYQMLGNGSALLKALWSAARRIEQKRARMESEWTERSAASQCNLALCFNKGAEGTVAFTFRWLHGSREYPGFLEIKFSKEHVAILDASDDFSEEIGKSYPRRGLPGSLVVAIRKGIKRSHQNAK